MSFWLFLLHICMSYQRGMQYVSLLLLFCIFQAPCAYPLHIFILVLWFLLHILSLLLNPCTSFPCAGFVCLYPCSFLAHIFLVLDLFVCVLDLSLHIFPLCWISLSDWVFVLGIRLLLCHFCFASQLIISLLYSLGGSISILWIDGRVLIESFPLWAIIKSVWTE